MRLLAIAAFVSLIVQEQNEAEKLFRKMESKILAAKTISFRAKGKMEVQGLEYSAVVLVGEQKRAKSTLELTKEGSTVTVSSTSDGKHIRVVATDGKTLPEMEPPEKLDLLLRKSFAAAGAVGLAESLSQAIKDPADPYTLSSFEMGPKEKIGAIEAQVVKYTVSTKYDTNVAAKVWIDPSTHLPLKRSVENVTRPFEESYLDLKLDEKIDAAKFELPK